ncbi:hypothetical protein [Rariglobus hedericola]|uniref:Uncharacterized protein n=1 Tax=Rariglobus hedericola TaxID=2597822 RepID=A0A556QJE9_9BACT|nr:hypothetical protein [Rariglobus hedericola]TSJ76766.1 hypothetical protein FPL22_11615 [Rariglobus hedericola]
MGFTGFYLMALLPIVIGFGLWLLNHRIALWEWLLTGVLAFIVAGCFHAGAISGMTDDQEVWSGQVLSTHYRPEWRERYKEAVYRTEIYYTGTGKNRQSHTRRVFSHYETRHRTHPDEWTVNTTLFSTEVSQSKYEQIRRELGARTKAAPGRRTTGSMSSTMVSGDPNDYDTGNTSGAIIPVAKNVSFENRVKASPSTFSYRQLTPEESAKLYDYPYIGDAWSTGRNLSGTLSTRKWDELNARLGPTKHVNLIVVRLKTPEEARALEAKWIGGKKNDLVLTYGESWSYVFGWTESTLAKTKLESLLRYHYPLDDRFIPEVEKVIVAHYKMVDWHKFDYLDLKPRTAHYWWLALTMFLTQAGAMTWAFMNGENRVRRMRPITYPKYNYAS